MHVLRPRSTEPRGLVGCTGEQPPQGPLAFTAPLPVLGEQRGAAAVTCAACSPAVHARRPVLLTGTLGGLGPAVRGRGSVPSGLCTAVTRRGRLSRLSPVGGLLPPQGLHRPAARGLRSLRWAPELTQWLQNSVPCSCGPGSPCPQVSAPHSHPHASPPGPLRPPSPQQRVPRVGPLPSVTPSPLPSGACPTRPGPPATVPLPGSPRRHDRASAWGR